MRKFVKYPVDRWHDQSYLPLSPRAKVLENYIYTQVSSIGIMELHLQVAEAKVGGELSEALESLSAAGWIVVDHPWVYHRRFLRENPVENRNMLKRAIFESQVLRHSRLAGEIVNELASAPNQFSLTLAMAVADHGSLELSPEVISSLTLEPDQEPKDKNPTLEEWLASTSVSDLAKKYNTTTQYVTTQIMKMKNWVSDNPDRAPRANWGRFMTNWMNRIPDAQVPRPAPANPRGRVF